MYRFVIVALVACQPPPPQPSYFAGQAPPPPYPSSAQPQPGYQQPAYQQPPAYPPQQPAYQQPPQPPTATCSQDLSCYGQCNPLTESCIDACDARTAPSDVQRAHTVLQCMGQSGCNDQNCVVQRCNAQLSACTGTPLASAPAAPAPAAPPASSGGTVPPGRYACQALSFTNNSLPHYEPSTMGTVEIVAGDRYHAPQFTGGDGSISLAGHYLTFVGGSLAGWVVWFDESPSGKFIRFDIKNHQHPQDSAHLGDALCYLQK